MMVGYLQVVGFAGCKLVQDKSRVLPEPSVVIFCDDLAAGVFEDQVGIEECRVSLDVTGPSLLKLKSVGEGLWRTAGECRGLAK